MISVFRSFAVIKIGAEPNRLARQAVFLARKIVKNVTALLKIEAKLIRIESLIMIALLFIVAIYAVLSVAEQRMADVRKMCSDLMRSAGKEFDLKQACSVFA